MYVSLPGLLYVSGFCEERFSKDFTADSKRHQSPFHRSWGNSLHKTEELVHQLTIQKEKLPQWRREYSWTSEWSPWSLQALVSDLAWSWSCVPEFSNFYHSLSKSWFSTPDGANLEKVPIVKYHPCVLYWWVLRTCLLFPSTLLPSFVGLLI